MKATYIYIYILIGMQFVILSSICLIQSETGAFKYALLDKVFRFIYISNFISYY